MEDKNVVKVPPRPQVKRPPGGGTTISGATSLKMANVSTSSSRPPIPKFPSTTPTNKAVALYKHDGKGEPNMLNFSVGDVIAITDQSDPAWWGGILGGVFGYFPPNHVQIIDETDENERGEGKEICVAVFSYTAQREDELSFPKGAIITVLMKKSNLWWQGRYKENTGMFPVTYIRQQQPQQPQQQQAPVPLTTGDKAKETAATTTNTTTTTSPATTPTTSSSNRGKQICVARFPYKAQREDELEFPKNAEIILLEQKTKQWWKGQIGDKVGMFPSNYVTMKEALPGSVSRPMSMKPQYKSEYLTMSTSSPSLLSRSDSEIVLSPGQSPVATKATPLPRIAPSKGAATSYIQQPMHGSPRPSQPFFTVVASNTPGEMPTTVALSEVPAALVVTGHIPVPPRPKLPVRAPTLKSQPSPASSPRAEGPKPSPSPTMGDEALPQATMTTTASSEETGKSEEGRDADSPAALRERVLKRKQSLLRKQQAQVFNKDGSGIVLDQEGQMVAGDESMPSIIDKEKESMDDTIKQQTPPTSPRSPSERQPITEKLSSSMPSPRTLSDRQPRVEKKELPSPSTSPRTPRSERQPKKEKKPSSTKRPKEPKPSTGDAKEKAPTTTSPRTPSKRQPKKEKKPATAPPVSPRTDTSDGAEGAAGGKGENNFDSIWNVFKKIATGEESEATSSDPRLGKKFDKLRRVGRLSGKFASPTHIRRTVHYVCSKLDALLDLVEQQRTQRFISEIEDILTQLNSISAGIKEFHLHAEKQVLVDLIRKFIIAAKDRMEGSINNEQFEAAVRQLSKNLKSLKDKIPLEQKTQFASLSLIASQSGRGGSSILFEKENDAEKEVPSSPQASEGPSSPSSSSDDNDKNKKMRQLVLEELITTEETYLLHLYTLMQSYIDPLKQLEFKVPVKSSSFWTLLSFVRPIMDVSKNIVGDLGTKSKRNKNAADVFIEMAPMFKMHEYENYINNYDEALSSFHDLLEKSSDFKKFSEKFCNDHGQPRLEFWLILPIQRLPRYELLLREILKYTDEKTEEHTKLSSALQRVKEANDFINQRKREDEARKRVVEIQNSIISKEPLTLVQRNRSLIREGPAFDVLKNGKKKSYYYFVFNDCIVKTKPHSFDKKSSTQAYKFVKTIPLLNATLCDVPFAPEVGAEATMKEDSIHSFYCISEEEKLEWMKDIGDAITKLCLKGGGSKSSSPSIKTRQVRTITIYGDQDEDKAL